MTCPSSRSVACTSIASYSRTRFVLCSHAWTTKQLSLNYHVPLPVQCPKVFITTHFIEALELLPKSRLLHFQAMEFSEQLERTPDRRPSMSTAARTPSKRAQNTTCNGSRVLVAQTPVRPGAITALDSSTAAGVSPKDAKRGREIVFLYRLVDGKSQDSFGRICAAMAGVDEAILEVRSCTRQF